METTLGAVKEVIEATLRIPVANIDDDTDFSSFGVNSIVAMQLITNLSERFDVSISPVEFSKVNSVRSLAGMLDDIVERRGLVVPVSAEHEHSAKRKTVIDSNGRTKAKKTGVRQVEHRLKKNSESESFLKALQYITERFGVDLSYRSFENLDEMVETLISDHYQEIAPHLNGSVSEKIAGEILAARASAPQRALTGDVAIVGVSCRFPGGDSPQAFWDSLMMHRCSIQEIPRTRWDYEEYYSETPQKNKTISKWAALIDNVDKFDPGFFAMPEDEALLMDPQQRLLILEVYKAFQDAGIDPTGLRGSNAGVFVAYEYGEYEHYMRKNFQRINPGPYPFFFSSSSQTYYLSNILSFLFDFHGPSESINVNCAGSAVALNRAYYSLITNESDVAVVGAVSLNLFAEDFVALSQYGMLSPNGTCAVFDDQANGFTRGEGVATVLMKRLEHAERDGNRIYGVLKACHQSNRGHARLLSEIKHEAIAEAIRGCYEKGGIPPESIRYIEVDGYSTKWGDSFEFGGIREALPKGTGKKDCALGSLKGNIGHLESVNGLASLIKMVMSFENGVIPATISVNKTNSFINIDDPSHGLYFATADLPTAELKASSEYPLRVGVNCFADSGVNVHFVVEEYPRRKIPPIAETPSPVSNLFILSTRDREGMGRYVRAFAEYLEQADSSSFFNDVLYTLQVGREQMAERLVVFCTSPEDLVSKLRAYLRDDSLNSVSHLKADVYQANVTTGDDSVLSDLLSNEMVSLYVEQVLLEGDQRKIAQLWVRGTSIPWDRVWHKDAKRIVRLPTYPFAQKRVWVRMADDKSHLSEVSIRPIAGSDVHATVHHDGMEAPSMQGGIVAEEKLGFFMRMETSRILDRPVEEISDEQNFLDMGMTSIGIGTIASKLINMLGISLTPGEIFNNLSIAKMSTHLGSIYRKKIDALSMPDFLSDGIPSAGFGVHASDVEKPDERTPERVLVPMRTTGKLRPIFAVPPGGSGSTLMLQHLILALGEDQPFYGFEGIRCGSIEDMAGENLTLMKSVQSKGPYRLLGYSNGGMVAYEMARQLMARREKVEALFFLDSQSPAIPRGDVVDDIAETFKHRFLNAAGEKVQLDLETLRRLPEEQRIGFLHDQMKKNGLDWPLKQFTDAYTMTLSVDECCRKYDPPGVASKLDTIVFRATESESGSAESGVEDRGTLGWDTLIPNKVAVKHIQANHYTLVEGNACREIAAIIRRIEKTSKKTERKKNRKTAGKTPVK